MLGMSISVTAMNNKIRWTSHSISCTFVASCVQRMNTETFLSVWHTQRDKQSEGRDDKSKKASAPKNMRMRKSSLAI